MKIAIAADHAGFALKERVKGFVAEAGHEPLDLGAFSEAPSDYPDFAKAIVEALKSNEADRGVLICGSGVGASVAANKFTGIRAGLCHDTYSARQGVEHDDMNILVLGGRVVGEGLAKELVSAFLEANFTGEDRHLRRLAKIAAFECPEG